MANREARVNFTSRTKKPAELSLEMETETWFDVGFEEHVSSYVAILSFCCLVKWVNF